MSSINTKIPSKSGGSRIASKIPTSGRDSGTHSRSSSVSNLTTASDIHSEIGDASSENTEDFKIDEQVWVNGTKPGYVKFIGKTQFAPGVWAGILLDEPIGKNDGSVAGVKYFTCEPQRGIFARPSKLTRTPGAISGRGDTSMVGSMTPKAGSALNSSRISLSSNISSCTTPRQLPKFRLGERITVSSLTGLKPGTLRFVGETDFAKGEWAGIELDEPTGKNDGSVAGKRYFTCKMKFGLFAPLHKVSRAAVSPPSRGGSVRGSSLLRSNSRDSLNSSISNASRTSRVKLGVISLTSSQKSKVSAGGVITATAASKALQDALKEKEQHIEQLLKEREAERSEFARIISHNEEMEAKSAELEKKLKKMEIDRKALEEQVIGMQRRLEDILFQLEEEKIAKSDFETQLQQRDQILKRIEEFVAKESGEKLLNIKEILAGQETLSETSEKSDAFLETEELQKKVAELEASLRQLSEEKQDVFNQLTELQKSSGDISLKNEILITSLNTTVQEKEDMISNLKNELNNNIEKVSQLIEDNRSLSDQIILKEQQAKGHADDVIKELGEKVNSLNEEVKTKSSQLDECMASIQEKDNKISTLEQSLNSETAALLQLQSQYKNVYDSLEQTQAKLTEKATAQLSLEESVTALKSQLESDSGEKQKKINLLEEELKIKTSHINDYLASIQEKENLLASLQQKFDAQATALSQLESEQKELKEKLKQKDLDIEEKMTKQKSVEEQIALLQSQNETQLAENEKKMLELVKEIEKLTNCVQEKEYQLVKAENELNLTQANVGELKDTIQQLSDKLQQADLSLSSAQIDSEEKIKALQSELATLNQEKEHIKSEYEKELEVLKNNAKAKEEELEARNAIIVQHESQISLLSEKLSKSESEYSDLKNELTNIAKKCKELCKEKESIEESLKVKEQLITEFKKQLDSLKASLDQSNLDLEQKEKQVHTLQEYMNVKEEENNQLISKLQLAEQNVEMLNKDSSQHVMALQNELSRLKEESTSVKTHLEQELSKMKSEKEKLSETISNKEKLLNEREESVIALEKKIKEKETEVANLSAQKEELLQSISKNNADIEMQQKNHQEKLSGIQSEYEAKVVEKEKELNTIRNEREKLLLTISEKENTLAEKEDILVSLYKKLEIEETEISNLSAQNSELTKNIAKFSSDIEEEQKLHQDKLSSSMMEYDNLLKEKDEAIQNIQSELKKYAENLENKVKELKDKENEVNALKNIVKEKDSQFDELSQMIESNQCQMLLLKQQNDKNESLLQSKESCINDFKADQERQLQLKEQNFKEEAARLEAIIHSRENEANQKESVISNLTSEIQEQKKLIESLQTQLETANVEKQKMSQDSSSIYEEFNKRISEMETKYAKLLEEKEKIAKEDQKTKEDKKTLELVRDSLIQEKSAQEEIVKDRESKLQALQTEVNRMQVEFSQHKQDLLQKLDVSQMELQAVSELKNQLELQHSVCEELQQELQNSEEKCKALEAQMQNIPHISSEKNKLQTELEEFQKINEEKSEMITNMKERNQTLEEQLNNNKNLCLQKDKELLSLKEQLQKLQNGQMLSGNLDSSVKSLEEENKSLKNKITLLELAKSEKKSEIPEKTSAKELTPEEAEERESLLSQIDFLNSIIVDMKQKNEELTRQLEIQSSCWEETDVNLNETKNAIAPRLFCDICDRFDLHETCDCPKQESYVDEEEAPQLKRPGTRKLEERPYCTNCEVFGHWTLDCDEQDTF